MHDCTYCDKIILLRCGLSFVVMIIRLDPYNVSLFLEKKKKRKKKKRVPESNFPEDENWLAR